MQKFLSKSKLNQWLRKIVSVLLIVLFGFAVQGANGFQVTIDNPVPDTITVPDMSGGFTIPLTVTALITSQLDPHLHGELTIANGKLKSLNDELKYTSLSGRTLEVFNLLSDTGSEYGVREVMRELEYSSPNLAYYHLNKLYNLGYVEKSDQNKYSVVQEVIEQMYPNNEVNQDTIRLNRINILFICVLTLLGVITLGYLVLGVSNKIWALSLSIVLMFSSIGFLKINNYAISSRL